MFNLKHRPSYKLTIGSTSSLWTEEELEEAVALAIKYDGKVEPYSSLLDNLLLAVQATIALMASLTVAIFVILFLSAL